MELKDVILSTLAEMEDDTQVDLQDNSEEFESYEPKTQQREIEKNVYAQQEHSSIESELVFLNSIRERLLVLFEGFQAPNNSNIEAKVDMTLNFLEYTLASIDSRVQILEKGARK